MEQTAFSDVDGRNDEVGVEVGEVESEDTDFGDGDGVNDFDDTYNEMNNGNETMEYIESAENIADSDIEEDSYYETTDNAVDSELDDFDDSTDSTSEQEIQTPNNSHFDELKAYDMTTDESVDVALSDFDDSRETDIEERLDNIIQNDKFELSYGIKEITKSHYDDGKELAKRSPENGRYYTGHGEAHVEMVSDKSLEFANAMKEAKDNGGLKGETNSERVAFSGNIDHKTLEGAALSHDTGMSGKGYALGNKGADGLYEAREVNVKDFNEVRSNHSLNSALNLLENRENYKKIGYTDEQVDKMAAECMAHSKSSSGVKDVNSKAEWSDCFNRIDGAVNAYNADNPDSQIYFNRDIFESNDEKFSSLVSETFALRNGDVSRDSFEGDESQSGEKVYVDRTKLNNHGGSIEKELEGVVITIGENGDTIDNLKSRQVHTGEQNIVKNRAYTNEAGDIVREVTVNDGSSAPICTQETIRDHLGELDTAGDGAFIVDVKFNAECDDFAQKKYNSFRDKIIFNEEYPNIKINYPWD